jgi:predicted MFS family arabinose efflux permease
VVLLTSFVFIETRTPMPLMPLRIFANRNRSGAYAIMLCVGTAVFAMFFFLTQFLQNILGYSPIKTGVAFLPMVVGIVTGAQVVSRLVARIGIRPPLLLGPLCAAAGLAWLSRLTPTSSYPDVLGPIVCIGLGMGLAFVPLTLTAVRGVRNEDTGLASALLNTAQQVGGALGLAVLATVAINATRNKATSLAVAGRGHLTRADVQAAATHGYTTAFLVGAAIALVAFVISLTVIRVDRTVTPALNVTVTPA